MLIIYTAAVADNADTNSQNSQTNNNVNAAVDEFQLKFSPQFGFLQLAMPLMLLYKKYADIIDSLFIVTKSNPKAKEEEDWFKQRYPYKNIYFGLSEYKSILLNCTNQTIMEFLDCEIVSHKKWHISIDDYFQKGIKELCCFIWDTMNCEIEQINKCNKTFAKLIELNTKRSYDSACGEIFCHYGSGCCTIFNPDNRSTYRWIAISVGIIMSLLLAICVCFSYKKITTPSSDVKPKITKDMIGPPKDFRIIKGVNQDLNLSKIPPSLSASTTSLASSSSSSLSTITIPDNLSIMNKQFQTILEQIFKVSS